MIRSTTGQSLFVTATIAGRIEHAEAGMIEEGTLAAGRRVGPENVFVRRLSGGIAAYADQGSPFNKIAGLGFEGVPEAAALAEVEEAFARRGAPLQVEVSTLADPGVFRLLTGRGYELVGFENVLGRALGAGMPGSPEDEPPAAIHITPVTPAEDAVWLDTVTTGFLHPDTFDGPPAHESFDREALERVFGDTAAAPGFERFLALREGRIAGGATLRIGGDVAQLCGASTLHEHRRRGVQSALLRYRLALASQRGCTVAVVTTQPGSKSQQNVERFGFALLYARAILVKPSPDHEPAK